MIRKSIIAGATVVALALTGCSSAADVASHNLSQAAENFEINRLIVGINGITDEVLFTVEGKCSIERDGDLVVTCMHGPGDVRKHYVGLSDNVTFISTQLDPVDVDEFRVRIILRPQTVLPDFDLSVGHK